MTIPSGQSMEFLKLHGIPTSTASSEASEKFRIVATGDQLWWENERIVAYEQMWQQS